MDEHILERWFDNIHVDQPGPIPADVFDDARDGRAAILRLHIDFPQIGFTLLVGGQIFNA
jgi:hypothetical protein